MDKTRAARRSGNCERAKSVHTQQDTNIVHDDYGRGALIAGLITAVSFGLMFVHAAVVM